ncbi:hypothetical protein J6590_102439 [Homalodisca vitripennis]|nr:hypothetical protein J6590_102439 [Homalodisca vitripennis]
MTVLVICTPLATSYGPRVEQTSGTIYIQCIDNVTAVDWENCVRHSENLQSDDWAKEIVRDDIMEPFIINLRDDSSDSENSDSDCDIDKD